MIKSYRPSDDEVMDLARLSLRRGAAGAASAALHRFSDLGPAPSGFERPRFGTPAYAIARKAGWISVQEEQEDRTAYAARRRRSLQTCHRYTFHERPRHAPPAERGTYVPELAARVEDDRNISDGARRCARKLAEIIYRQNREGRFTAITVSYLMEALHRSRRTVQRYLRLLEREGYIDTQVVRGARSRLCTGLLIALRGPVFARHHKKGWPCKAANPGASKESQNYSFIDSLRGRERLSVRQWSLLCMDGVFRAFMKTDPLGLMEKSSPLKA